MNFSNYPFWQCYKPSYISPAKLSHQPLSITWSIAIVIRFRFFEELITNLVHQMVIVCCSVCCIIKGTSTLNAKALLIIGFKRVETNCNQAHRYPPGEQTFSRYQLSLFSSPHRNDDDNNTKPWVLTIFFLLTVVFNSACGGSWICFICFLVS